MRERLRHAIVFLGYVALALIFTLPLAAHLGTAIPTTGHWDIGDPAIFIWLFDLCAKAVTGHLPVAAGQMLFYPQGISLFAGYDGPLMLLFGVPLTLLSGNALWAYDVFILTAISGSAFAAYLLGIRLLRSRPAAILVGFLFGCSPYMLVRAAQHPNLLMIGTLPLLVLAMLRCGENPKNARAYAWLALAAFANAASSWYYAISGLLFLGLIVIAQRETWRRHFLGLMAAGAVVATATAIVALPMLLSPARDGKPAEAAFTARMGARPIDFILPNSLTNVFGSLRENLHDDPPPVEGLPIPNTFERSSYFGIPLLAAVAAFVARRRKTRVPHPMLWIVGFFLFTALSLGTEMTAAGHAIRLPFAFLWKIFPFSLMRVPNRAFVAALLCAAVMAGDVFSQLVESGFFSKRLGKALAFAGVLLLLSERLIFPFPTLTQPVSAFYKDIAADGQSYAVADIPNPYPQYSDYDFFQITHGKPVTGGDYFYPAFTQRAYAFLAANPLMRASACGSHKDDGTDIDLARDVWPSFREHHIRYVVVHNLLFYNIPECAGLQRRVRDILKDEKPVFYDGELTVYRVPDAAK